MQYICSAAAALGLKTCTAPVTALESAFYAHVLDYGLSYATREEYLFRLQQYKRADAAIAAINSDPANTFKAAHNMFSTWTDAEYKRLLGDKPHSDAATEYTVLPETETPDSLDWRAQGAVNPVRNQGQCGSCWTFAAVAVLEGHHAIEHGELLQLSEQQIVDCDHDNGVDGCRGGLAALALQWVQEGHPLATRDSYPYVAADGTCNQAAQGVAGVSSVTNVTKFSLSQTLEAAKLGPVGISVAAGNDIFRFYKSGVLNNAKCAEYGLDHAIAIVGFGTDPEGGDYWIVRNSWGTSWGEEGYIRLGRVEGAGICGCQTRPVWASTANAVASF